MNPLRKILHRTGFDFHRYSSVPNKLDVLKTLNIQTVLDIGANVGQFAREIRNVLPHAYIHSFEPLGDAYKKLEQNMANDKNFKAFNFALGEENITLFMEKNEYSPSSSILPLGKSHTELFPHAKQTVKEEIVVKKLDDVFAELNLKKEMLIKVDVQGFEDKVILGGQKTFSQAKAVSIETSFVELYQTQPTFDDIYSVLKNLNFTYRGSLQEKVDGKTGKIISEDSLFVK